jgi:hypothetical protein
MVPNGAPRSRRWIGSRCRPEVSLGLRPRLCRSPSLPSLAGAGADRIALELGQPAEQGQHQTPCAVVVSAHSIASERKPAFFPAIAESQVQAMQGGRVLLSPFDAVVGLYVPDPGEAELGAGAWRGAAVDALCSRPGWARNTKTSVIPERGCSPRVRNP